MPLSPGWIVSPSPPTAVATTGRPNPKARNGTPLWEMLRYGSTMQSAAANNGSIWSSEMCESNSRVRCRTMWGWLVYGDVAFWNRLQTRSWLPHRTHPRCKPGFETMDNVTYLTTNPVCGIMVVDWQP